MNHNLDSLELVQKLDTEGVSTSIASLGEQVQDAWSGVKALEIVEDLGSKKQIIVSGMGGSALGGRVVQSLFSDSLRAPLIVSTESFLPHWVGIDTLVIISSYSGNTAETIEALRDAQSKSASIFIIATGGKLAEIAKTDSIPAFIFDPKENPSGMPRMALGYSIASILGLLARFEFITFTDADIQKVTQVLEKYNHEWQPRAHTNSNLAKTIAIKLFEKAPILIASQHLVGVSHAFKNQLNENAKTFASLFDLPELNHHFIEGLQFPHSAKQNLHLLFFESEKYREDYQKRYPIIEEIVEKNSFAFTTYQLQSNTKLEQVFEMLVFGSYVSFYLAILNGINPAPIPWVDYLKEKLSF
jgi:glucose/mannose-6-phosphate isomerase